jgi:dTDP-4-dehydrorhamnose reductase
LLAEVTAHLIRQMSQNSGDPFPFGLYHLCASGDTTWFDYARFVLEQAEASKSATRPALKVTASDVVAIPGSQYATLAQRPGNSRLDTTKFKQTFALPLPSWQDGLKPILDQIL